MVIRALLVLATCVGLFGCGATEDNPTPRTSAKTKEEQIAEIRARTDMPEDVKEQAIQSLGGSAPAPAGK